MARSGLPSMRKVEKCMARTVMLLCAAGTRSSRTGAFAAPDEPLDAASRDAAGRIVIDRRFQAEVAISPARAAVETAQALGLSGQEEVALADVDHGNWAGRSFADIHAEAPEALARWLADPAFAPPGGEAMQDVAVRAGRWLDAIAPGEGALCAITHATVIRAVLAHALGLPLRATLAIDVAPLSRAVLSFNGIWRLQAIGPFD